jgi:peptidoglycan/LPS O-acetylase OafA/YrhL
LVGLVLLPLIPLLRPIGWGHLVSDQKWVWFYATNILTSLRGHFSPSAGKVSFVHFWSLAVEEHSYLIWPLLVYLLRPKRLVWACLTLIIMAPALRCYVVLAHRDTLTAYVLTPMRCDGLALGALCATLLRGKTARPILIAIAPWVLTLAGLILAVIFLRNGLNLSCTSVATLGYSVTAAFFAALLVCVVSSENRGWLVALFEARWLGFFGRYSYGIYALHAPAMALLIDNKPLCAFVTKGVRSQTLGSWILEVLTIAMSVGVAVLSWHLYEKQFLKLKRFFEPQKRADSTAAVRVESFGLSEPATVVDAAV